MTQSVDLCICETPTRGEVIHQTGVRQAILGVGFLELLPGDHDRHRGFGHEVVGEGAQEDAVAIRNVSAGTRRRSGEGKQTLLAHFDLEIPE